MKSAETLYVIECSGTSYEIGFQIGTACKETLRTSLDTTLGILARGFQTSSDEIVATASKYLPAVQAYDPDFIEQLHGQADAIGVPFERMFTLRCVFELSFYYQNILALCTSFAVSGKATADGETILGQNIDWIPAYSTYLLKIQYPNGITNLSISLGGMVEYTLSSAGFGIACNSIFTNPKGFRFHLPLGCYLPKVMKQTSFQQAVELLQQVARGVGYYHLASADGEMIGIESVFHDFEIVHPVHYSLVHSNCYCTERFQSEDMASTILPDSFERNKRMKELIGQHYGSITPKTMMNILSDHHHSPYSICRHGNPDRPAAWEMQTIASIIMVPEERVMYIANGSPCTIDYVKYTL